MVTEEENSAGRINESRVEGFEYELERGQTDLLRSSGSSSPKSRFFASLRMTGEDEADGSRLKWAEESLLPEQIRE